MSDPDNRADRVSAVLERTPDVVYHTDADGRLTSVTGAIETVLGFTPAELSGKLMFDLVHPEDRDDAVAGFRLSVQRRDAEVRMIETRLIDKSGGTRHFELHRRLHFDSEGRLEGGEGIARDVTDNHLAQERLRLYEAIITASDDAVAILDADGRFLESNPAHQRLLGYSVDELRDAQQPIWCSPEDAESLAAALRGSASFRGDVEARTKDGRTLHIDLSVFPLRGADGGIERFVGFARDVTQRRREELRRQVFQQLREQVLTMTGEADLDGVLTELESGLVALGINYQNCGINLLDLTTEPVSMRSRSSKPGGGWIESDTPRADAAVHQMWQRGEPTYRRDLQADDPFGELRYLQKYAPIRCVLDLPFSHGTLALNSTEPNAFSDEDLLLLQEITGVLSSGFQRIDDLRRLALSEQRYRTLIETPDFIVFLLDPAGNYIYVTPRVREWLGLEPEDFYTDRAIGEKIIHPDDVEAVGRSFQEALKGVVVEGIEYRWRNQSGEYRWASSGVYPIVARDGSVHTVQVVIHDVTRLKDLLEQTERANRELLETQTRLIQADKMAALGNLVAGIAHEINTPVGAIHSMHDTLVRAVSKLKTTMETQYPDCCQEGNPLGKALKVIEDSNRVIETGTQRVTTIVRSLRNFARLDQAERKAANLHEGLDDSLMLIHHDIKNRVEIARDYGDIPEVMCYPGRLNQVFLNILNNAQQAIDGSGTITIRTCLVQQDVHVTITDTGAGIPKEQIGRIFDPGFTTKGVGVGTGLGLSICYQIMQDHGGRIDVQSEVGTGTSVTIVIPVNPSELQPLD